ncbi:DUF3558 domain-containing protein [Nocardia sp. NPDC056064]|uniref:DUF3558 domain-containing protein n=1 Tax=Nocardia sp. NPDC056064 TaxID=3345701 RepID=UPI0035E1867D
MTNWRAGFACGAVVAVCSWVAGCNGEATIDQPDGASSGAPSSTTSATRPTLTAAKLQPPSQDNKYTQAGGRPKVVVDPCTWIPDDIVGTIGIDPATRQRGRDLVAEYTFLTCDFASATSGADWFLSVESGNVSLDEVRQKYAGKTENIEINGREAVRTVKVGDQTCDVDLETSVGYLGVGASYHGIPGTNSQTPCDKAMEYARALEPVIGDGN